MKVTIDIPEKDIKEACESIGCDPNDPTARELIEYGIQDHIRYRDWSLSDLLVVPSLRNSNIIIVWKTLY